MDSTIDLKSILDKHAKWLQSAGDGSRANLSEANLSRENLSEADLSRAYLSEANLSGADLSRADLSGANLSEANLSEANLSRADLSRANLSEANLSRANLSEANLSGADLSRANLSRADLSGTCLDPQILIWRLRFMAACPVDNEGYRTVYRTAKSQYVGNAIYEPGQSYTAPWISWDSATACHPGIYAGNYDQIKAQYPQTPLVRCRVRDSDWVVCEKGIRCAALEVLELIE